LEVLANFTIEGDSSTGEITHTAELTHFSKVFYWRAYAYKAYLSPPTVVKLKDDSWQINLRIEHVFDSSWKDSPYPGVWTVHMFLRYIGFDPVDVKGTPHEPVFFISPGDTKNFEKTFYCSDTGKGEYRVEITSTSYHKDPKTGKETPYTFRDSVWGDALCNPVEPASHLFTPQDPLIKYGYDYDDLRKMDQSQIYDLPSNFTVPAYAVLLDEEWYSLPFPETQWRTYAPHQAPHRECSENYYYGTFGYAFTSDPQSDKGYKLVKVPEPPDPPYVCSWSSVDYYTGTLELTPNQLIEWFKFYPAYEVADGHGIG